MAITRWARRAVLTATALAFALPFSTGTAQADPIIEVLADNNVNATVGAYNNNVDSIPVSLGAGASLNTGSGITLDTNEGIQLAMDIGQADVSADAAVGVPFTDIGVEASAAAGVDVPEVSVAAENAEVSATADEGDVDVAADIAAPPAAEPEVVAPPAPAAAPVLESAVTITDDTAVAADESKGDDADGDCRKGRGDGDCPDDGDDGDEEAGCPNLTALGIVSACLLPDLVQIHI